jgi:hypothetical protein
MHAKLIGMKCMSLTGDHFGKVLPSRVLIQREEIQQLILIAEEPTLQEAE